MRLISTASLGLLALAATQSHAQVMRQGLQPGELGVNIKCYIGKKPKNRFFNLSKRGLGAEAAATACKEEQPLWNRIVEPWNGTYEVTYVTREEDFKHKKYGS
jgi:hypothetical protein